MTCASDDPYHECPTPLRARAGEFDVGGMVFTPAGRWEHITDVDRSGFASVVVVTDRAVWRFWPSEQLPYLARWEAHTEPGPRVVVDETTHTITVEVRRHHGGRGHVLATATQARGQGWVIQDRPDGATDDQVVIDTRAKARTEIRRRARAHAQRLGLPLTESR